MSEEITASGTLWRWEGANGGGWIFLTIDGEPGESLSAAEAMRRLELGSGRGFGSLKISARIGASEWQTSCFPSKELGWLLPVKAAIRKAEGLGEGDTVRAVLTPL